MVEMIETAAILNQATGNSIVILDEVGRRLIPDIHERIVTKFHYTPANFGTDLNAEYAIAADLLDLEEAGLKALATTAVDVSFAPDDVKARLRGEIADYAG